MSTLASNYLDIIERLPAGAKLELFHTDWDEYERLLSQMGDFPGHRLSYDRGRLIILSPKREHEFFKSFIGKMSQVLSYEVIQNSLALPTLAAEDLTQYLGRSKTEGQTVAPKAFRRMLRSRASS